MIVAVMRVMLLALARDRAALVMAFALPAAIYLIFASIFSGTAGEKLQLSVAVLDQAKDDASRRLVSALSNDPRLQIATLQPQSRQDLELAVRRGEIDAGIVIRDDMSKLSNQAPILILGDVARAVAAPIVNGRVQKILGEKLPDAVYRRAIADFDQNFAPLTAQQRARADAVLQAMAEKARQNSGDEGSPAPNGRAPMVEMLEVARNRGADAAVVYYAGAVSILFLLISASQGAMLLIEERRNGILDRLTSSAGGLARAVTGKFLFLTLQGAAQVGIIFIVAAWVYGVAVLARPVEWGLLTLAAAAMASGAALLLCAVCQTRQQAQTLSSFLVLVLSAVGGSMVPIYLMPQWLQKVSLFTPNAWAIQAYQDLLWRDAPMASVLSYAAMLLGAGLATAALAWLFLLRERRS
jgi:ABC-2 type transport system permease protein